MKQLSSTKTLRVKQKELENELDAKMENMILPELKSPSNSLVNSLLNYSKSLSISETQMGKIANVMN